MEDYYTIQTPEHHSSLFTQLHALQKQGVMCDVILAAEDGEVMAHKVILMAVSKYFREKLSPVISSTATRVFLKGIPVIELANLVKYIYTGKLLIAKETMDITLEVAEILQLNGVVNGYKEILAYEHLKVQPSVESSVTDVKPDKQSAEYAAFNVQVEQYTEEPVHEEQTYGTDQAVMQNGYQEPRVENDGAVQVASSETITTVPTSTLNTSTEYAFETNLYEDQYYDVTVGSTVSVQSDNQINTMPSLQKMISTMSADGNQSQHQDLLSVAIETLTDANYLSSPPGKDPRHAYPTVGSPAVSYSTSVSNVDTSSLSQGQLPDPLASSTFKSNPTPTAMVVNSSTPIQSKRNRSGPKAKNTVEPANGNIPVYRVSLPPTTAVLSETPKPGRPVKPESEKRGRGRPRKSLLEPEEVSPPARTSRAGRLLVSPQLTKPGQRAKEVEEGGSESKRKLTLAAKKGEESVKKSDPHLNKVVEDLKTKVSETRAAKKKGIETKETDTATVQIETAETKNDKAESSTSITEASETNVEDFGQSVNFDSDDDDNYDDNDDQDIALNENIEKIVDALATNLPETAQETEERNDPKEKGKEVGKKGADSTTKAKVISYFDLAKKKSSSILSEREPGTPKTPGEEKAETPKAIINKTNEEKIEMPKAQSNKPSKENSEKPKAPNIEPSEGKIEMSKAPGNQPSEEKTETPRIPNIKSIEGIIEPSEGKIEMSKPPSNQPIEEKVEKKTPNKKTNEIMTRGKQNQVKKQLIIVENNKTPEETESDKNTKGKTDDSEIFKIPKGDNEENKETEVADEGIGSSMKEDLRSSASKRKTKAPRRLTDNTKAKTSLNKDIPMVRTRRTSKNDANNEDKTKSNGPATDIKIHEDKAKTGNKKGKEAEKEKIDLAIPITGKEAKKASKQNLQPVVKLMKQSKETIMSMAREIAASSSPRKRKPEKIEVEIQQTDVAEFVKKKSRKPTEPQPVSALKNRQKDDEDDDDDDDDIASGSDDEDGYIEVEIKEMEEAINKKKDNSIGGAPTMETSKKNDSVNEIPKGPQAEITCKNCNKVFRYRMQLSKHMQTCKFTESASKRDQNIFADIQGNTGDPDKSAVNKRSRSGTPESTTSVTLEIVPFNLKDGEKLKKLSGNETGEGKGKLYVCHEKACNFSTESPAAAARHQSVHRIRGVCNECGMCFTSEARFKDHECGLLCSTCNIMFETKTDMATHLEEKHEVEDENVIVDSKVVIVKEVKEEAEKEIKTETNEPSASKRTRRSVEKKVWPCVLCEEVLPSREELVSHENSHDLTCSCCNVKFTTARKYKYHIVTQKRKSTELICFICNKSFSRRTDQRKHMFKFHGSPAVTDDGKKELKVFQCDICSFVAWSERLLNLHKKAHSGVKDIPCPQCKKMFLSKYDVNRHIKTVHGPLKGRFKCGQEGCGFSTATMRSLKTHLQLKHSDEKTLILCPFCDYKAALKGNLDKHLRTIHKLEVVSKMTLKDRERYGDLKHGTIITKDGREVTEDDIENFKRPCRGSKEREKEKMIATVEKPKRKRPKTIEEFTQEIMAKHMRRLESPVVEKDYRSSTLDTALTQPAFPQASVTVRRENLAAKGIAHRPRMILQYDKIDPDEAVQYAVEEDYDEMGKEVIVDDGIVPLPTTGMSVGNEVYIIEAGKSENIIESDFPQPFIENDYEDETTRSLRVLTNNNENEDETSRSLRVLTTLLEAGQHG